MPAALRPVAYRVDPFDLRLFTVVLELGTITAAARALGLSLAAASARLQALENVVGTPLLARAKSGSTATDAGRALARRAHGLLAELESLHLEMGRFRGGLRGTLRLLGNTSAMSEALPPVLGRFLAQHPDIDVETQELPSDAVLDALRRGAGDLGIVASHVDTEGLAVQPWVDDQLVALLPRTVASAGAARAAPRGAPHDPLQDPQNLQALRDPLADALRHTLRRARRVHFNQLLDLPFVGLPAASGLSRFLAQQARVGGRWLHHRARVGSFDAVAQLVAAGAGVAVMPLSAAQRCSSASLRVLPLHEPWARRQLRVCTRPDATRSPALQALLDCLRVP